MSTTEQTEGSLEEAPSLDSAKERDDTTEAAVKPEYTLESIFVSPPYGHVIWLCMLLSSNNSNDVFCACLDVLNILRKDQEL